ncbi:MAG: ABC transporter permease [Ktedonobacterales bacterium]|nr:ABC transporter permease [Ktedonobacterales bacterium]
MTRTRDASAVTLWLLGAVALVYLGLPIANLLVVEPWREVPAALADPQATGALATSLITAGISTLLIAIFGVPLAYVLARWRFRLRPLVTLLVYVPLVFPAVVSGIAQLLVYGPYGPIGAFWAGRGLELDTSLAGVVLAQTFVAAPFAIVAARAAFEAGNLATEDVARTLGASRWRVFWTVSLPLARGGVIAGLILTWLRAIGEFGATAVLAYHPYTLPVYTYVQLTGLGVPAALPLALLALVASVVAIGAALLATARGHIPGGHG